LKAFWTDEKYGKQCAKRSLEYLRGPCKREIAGNSKVIYKRFIFKYLDVFIQGARFPHQFDRLKIS